MPSAIPSDLPEDLQAALSLGRQLLEHYAVVADKRHWFVDVVSEDAKRAIVHSIGEVIDLCPRLDNFDMCFDRGLLREISECRASSPGPFRPFDFDRAGRPEWYPNGDQSAVFESALRLVDLLAYELYWLGVAYKRFCENYGSTELGFYYLLGRRALLPAADTEELSKEIEREVRAAATVRAGLGPWSTTTQEPQHLESSEIDELVTLDQAAPLTGLSKRTLEKYLRDGRIPEPDIRGGGGRAHKWRWRNLRPALAGVANKILPDKFPGSRIV